jgi:hypothetical protein
VGNSKDVKPKTNISLFDGVKEIVELFRGYGVEATNYKETREQVMHVLDGQTAPRHFTSLDQVTFSVERRLCRIMTDPISGSGTTLNLTFFVNPQGALAAVVEGIQTPFGDVSHGITQESAARLGRILLQQLGIQSYFDSL